MIYFKNDKQKQGFNHYVRSRPLEKQKSECPFDKDSEDGKDWLSGLQFHHRLYEPYTI